MIALHSQSKSGWGIWGGIVEPASCFELTFSSNMMCIPDKSGVSIFIVTVGQAGTLTVIDTIAGNQSDDTFCAVSVVLLENS